MAEYMTNTEDMTSVANAIRTKSGTSGQIVFPSGFVSAIQNIPSGGEQSYLYYRLTITDLRRNGGSTAQTFGSCAEFAVYDKDNINLARLTGCEYSCNTYIDKPASYAFDGNINSFWESNWNGAASTTNWVQVKLPSAQVVKSVGITPRNASGYRDYACDFTIGGSNDGQTWITILQQEDLTDGWTYGVERLFDISTTQEKTVRILENGTVTVTPDAGKILTKVTVNTQLGITPYKYYRLYITKFMRSDSQVSFANIAEFYLYNINTELSHQTGCIYTANSRDDSYNDANKAFDNNNGTFWHSHLGNTINWLCVQLPVASKITSFGIITRSDSYNTDIPVDFKLQGSNDNTIWDDLYVASNLTDGWTAGVKRTFTVERPGIQALSVTSNGTYTPSSEIVGYNPVTVNVQPVLNTITITENGVYTVPIGVDGYNLINVNVSGGGPSYTEVKYLESLTTHYIDTGIIINNDDCIELTVQNIAYSSTGYAGVFGARTYWNNIDAYDIAYHRSSSTHYIAYNIGGITNDYAIIVNRTNFQEIYADANKIIVDGTQIALSTSFAACNYSCYLFAINQNTSRPDCGRFKISKFKISDKLNCTPVIRNLDNKPGMYDSVTNTFFINQGSGDFGYEKLDGTYVAPY